MLVDLMKGGGHRSNSSHRGPKGKHQRADNVGVRVPGAVPHSTSYINSHTNSNAF